ncbi:hypothetical protein PINS_up000516 [Pythium insidiosum]|nr:hypothetical protein PINS_up000516 [Pythium insidiosum]
MVRQSEQDPSVFYVYHTPFLRRVLLQDTLPRVANGTQPLIAVRAFGVRVDESAQEWLWSNVVSSHRPLSLKLLHRCVRLESFMLSDESSSTRDDRLEGVGDGDETVATCLIKMKKLPFDRDLANELVSLGLAESIPETMSKYENGRANSVGALAQRMHQLESAQKHAQTMQYGIWKDWSEEHLKDRVVSAGKRLTTRGFQKLIKSVSG